MVSLSSDPDYDEPVEVGAPMPFYQRMIATEVYDKLIKEGKPIPAVYQQLVPYQGPSTATSVPVEGICELNSKMKLNERKDSSSEDSGPLDLK